MVFAMRSLVSGVCVVQLQLVWVTTALVALMPGMQAVSAQDVLPKTIADVKRAVLPVVCGALDQKNQFRVVQIVASGFLVNARGDFVTAAHVVEDLSKVAAQQQCVGAT